jgi:hypothetical protein
MKAKVASNLMVEKKRGAPAFSAMEPERRQILGGRIELREVFGSPISLEDIGVDPLIAAEAERYARGLHQQVRRTHHPEALGWTSPDLATGTVPDTVSRLAGEIARRTVSGVSDHLLARSATKVVARPIPEAARSSFLVVPPRGCVPPFTALPLGPTTWASLAFIGASPRRGDPILVRFYNPCSAYRASTGATFAQFGATERYRDISLLPGKMVLFPGWVSGIVMPHFLGQDRHPVETRTTAVLLLTFRGLRCELRPVKKVSKPTRGPARL